MQPAPSASSPSSTEVDAAARAGTGRVRWVRLALGAWAAFVYLVYWLGYLGLR